MPKETLAPSQENIIGRGGLIIPKYEVEAEGTPSNIDLLWFFEKLWEANGLGHSKDQYNRDKTENFRHELVVPATDDKPAAILIGFYQFRDSKEVEREEIIRDANYKGWGSKSSIIRGYEMHGIFLLPDELGPLVPFLRVSREDGVEYPWEDTGVLWQNRAFSKRDFEPDINEQMKMSVPEIKNKTKIVFTEKLNEIIVETTRFLS